MSKLAFYWIMVTLMALTIFGTCWSIWHVDTHPEKSPTPYPTPQVEVPRQDAR